MPPRGAWLPVGCGYEVRPLPRTVHTRTGEDCSFACRNNPPKLPEGSREGGPGGWHGTHYETKDAPGPLAPGSPPVILLMRDDRLTPWACPQATAPRQPGQCGAGDHGGAGGPVGSQESPAGGQRPPGRRALGRRLGFGRQSPRDHVCPWPGKAGLGCPPRGRQAVMRGFPAHWRPALRARADARGGAGVKGIFGLPDEH